MAEPEIKQVLEGFRDETLKTLEAKHASALAELKDFVSKQVEEVKASGKAHQETLDAIGAIRKRIDGLEAELRHADASKPQQTKTLADQIIESEGFKEMRERNDRNLKASARFVIKDRPLVVPVEYKTTITSATVGSSTPGILIPQRLEGIVPQPRRRFTMRDLLSAAPTANNTVEYVRENAFTNAASPQTEASDKAESALTFTIGYAPVRTIAHWIPATRQVLDDFVELRAYLNDMMMYGLKLKEETEILTGDGTGVHLTGLTTAATAYADTYNAANDTKLDTLRHAILELEDDDDNCNFFVVNPKDYHDIELIKNEEGGTANKGFYVVGDPHGGTMALRTLWGRPVIVTNSITSGYFLCGDLNFAQIRDRQDATVDISTEHSDYFIKNLVAIRVEERLALAIRRTTAFRYGAF